MTFKQINVNEQIIEKNDAESDTLWQESGNEYKLLAGLVKIRKKANLCQTEFSKKQIILSKI